jgi:alpha-galactosidase
MPIHVTEKNWVLETANTAYALGLNANGRLVHRYWGAKLPHLTDYPAPRDSMGWASFNGEGEIVPEEYPGYAGATYLEPCLKVAFADGVRDVVLEFERHEILGNELRIHLRDLHYPFRVTLHYRIHERFDLLERFVTVHNDDQNVVMLERIFSAQWHAPLSEPYRLTHLAGAWFKETQLVREPLTLGTKVLESRRITTSHQHNPWFALDRLEHGASEDSGEVWFGCLSWSGNWKLTAEHTIYGSTRISIGLNDWDFAMRLEPNTSFKSPSSIAGFSNRGFGGASRNLHDFVRQTILPHGVTPHKVLYNSWEATTFNVDVDSQIALATIAAEIGTELFVLDDGWFHGRSSDNAALGDWWPDEIKFPNGLNPLIEKVNALGMDFGLWLEPEMVNPNSELYRAHPDWVIHFPTRARTEMRQQLILNLARVDVQDYLIDLIDRLLANHQIAFIKWDMNRNVSEPGWPAQHDKGLEARELWVRYVEGLYRVWGTLRERHPNVIWQSCSGGGGRADLEILRYTDQIWTSDMTEPTMRLQIQEGFSQLFPAITMEAWVTDMGSKHLPLEFRFHVSMAGSLGVGSNLNHWSAAERLEAKNLIALYKDVRHVIQQGDLYRLRSAFNGGFSSLMYVSKNQSEAVVFAFRTHIPNPVKLPPLHLRGLEPDALYEIKGYGTRSGKAWAEIGLEFPTGPMAFGFEFENYAPPSDVVLPDGWRLSAFNFSSAVLKIRRVEKA